MNRHHLLPRQILTKPCFVDLLERLGRDRLDLEDFRTNGMLLPANDLAAVRIGLPLHRGPHRDYNQMVLERVGLIEAGWSCRRYRMDEAALRAAGEALDQLQRRLRAELLDQRQRLKLNRRDPLGQGHDFTELDAMADRLWGATGGAS